MFKETQLNFFCIGAQKAGTTTLHEILIQHPEIYLPQRKEAHFFDVDDLFEKGLDWYYNEFYPDYNNEKVVGSITPEYCFFPIVPQRLYETFGQNLKFIFILREPVNRAVSHYNMSKGRLYEDLSFDEAVKIEKERITKGEFEFNHFSYFSRGNYVEQIKRYVQFFPIENFLFLDFDNNIKTNIEQTIDSIQLFLQIEHVKLNTNIHSNKAFTYSKNRFTKRFLRQKRKKSIWKKVFPKKLRRFIIHGILDLYKKPNEDKFILDHEKKAYYYNKYFKEELDELEKITNLNLSHWRK